MISLVLFAFIFMSNLGWGLNASLKYISLYWRSINDTRPRKEDIHMEQEFEHRMKLVLLRILLNQGKINAPTYDKVKKGLLEERRN